MFFDTRFSASGNISCNSCHDLTKGGSDNRVASLGVAWQLGGINSPTVLNSAFSFVQFWDGRAKDLEEQSLGPIGNPIEMGSSVEAAIKILSSIPKYKSEFEDIFGSDEIKLEHIGSVIAEFERTLITPNSPFDKWLIGNDNAMTDEQKEGYNLFNATGCIACHNGVNIGSSSFQKMGLVQVYDTLNK